MRSSVVLPQPLGPSKTMNSVSATVSVTSVTAEALPPGYVFEMPSMRISLT